jgi:pyridoxal phosphate enzyme (YggS family)
MRRIERAATAVGRSPREVTLIAVTKTVAAETVAHARAAGLEHFGENYAKDLAAKAEAVEATWHYIGKLQSGTARLVADHADVVHSAESGRAVLRLAHRAAAAGRQIPCLVEVDFTARRQGVAPADVGSFLAETAEVDGIRMVGMMTVPPPTPDPEGARPYFRRLRELLEEHRDRYPGLDELSMGMSADFEIAVEEGATMVRVGTALFGDRPGAGAEPAAPGTAPGERDLRRR